MKRIFVFLSALLLLANFISAAGTETSTTFVIGGCSDSFGGEPITAAKDSCYLDTQSVNYKKYYCNSEGSFVPTLLPSNGCSLGKNTLEGVSSNNTCCPGDYFCQEVEPSLFQCVQRTEPCATYETQEICESWQCAWFGGSCVKQEALSDESCGVYENQSDCEADAWNLAKIGIGTDILGESIECNDEVYTISEDSSSCVWNDSRPDGSKCYLNYVAGEMFAGSTSMGSFECSNTYTLGNCTNGEQSVIWESSSEVVGGGSVPQECLLALGCAGGESSRICGDETIKLPGFSMFSFIASIILVSVVYAIKVGKLK